MLATNNLLSLLPLLTSRHPSLAKQSPQNLQSALNNLAREMADAPPEVAEAVLQTAPHLVLAQQRSRRRERLYAALIKSESAHAGLLARCKLEPSKSEEAMQQRRRRVPRVSATPVAPSTLSKQLRIWQPDGLPIRAHADVPDAALFVAAERVGRMLRQQSASVRERLHRSRASIHIVGRQQQVSDLPEHRHLRGKRGDYAHEANDDPRRITRYGLWAERTDDGRSFRLPLFSAESLWVQLASTPRILEP